MLQDFNTAEMTEIFTRGRQTLGNSNTFWQKPQKSLLTTPPCILASVSSPRERTSPSPTVQLDGARLRWSLCWHCGAAPTAASRPVFLLLAFEESLMIHSTLTISTRFFSVHNGFLRALEAILQHCCAGDGESLLCAIEAGNRKRLYLHTIKINRSIATEVVFLLCATSSSLPGL